MHWTKTLNYFQLRRHIGFVFCLLKMTKICNSVLKGKINSFISKSSTKKSRFNQIFAINSLMNYKACYFCCCFTDLAPYQFSSIFLFGSFFFSRSMNKSKCMYVHEKEKWKIFLQLPHVIDDQNTHYVEGNLTRFFLVFCFFLPFLTINSFFKKHEVKIKSEQQKFVCE